jgi:hypothetical protein
VFWLVVSGIIATTEDHFLLHTHHSSIGRKNNSFYLVSGSVCCVRSSLQRKIYTMINKITYAALLYGIIQIIIIIIAQIIIAQIIIIIIYTT